jgi:benzoate membrane transport protein
MREFPVSAITAGFIAVLVGYTGSAAIIFQAATSAGANEQMIASWMCILGIAMGITTIGLSLYYRAPVLTAWSTPGAAVLVTTLAGFTMAEAVGAFVFSAGLIVLFGVTGWFEKIMDRIPFAIVSALLAGVLGKFGIDIFIAMQSSWQLVLPMFVSYLIFKSFTKTYVVPLVFLFAMILAAGLGMSSYSKVGLSVSELIWTTPEFSFSGILTISVPLFVVTMASQNIPGVGVLRANGYQTPVSPVVTCTGLATFILAPFGCFAINYAAITAAICAGEGAHPDREKRYIASVSAGVFYVLTGVFAATFVALFAAFPEALVLAIAGIALLSTIANSMKQAMEGDEHREPALATFLVTISGMTLWGIGSAFWGIVFGLLTLVVLQPRRRT